MALGTRDASGHYCLARVSSGEKLLMLTNFKIQEPKSWEDVAKQLAQESDPDTICELSEELIAAIDAQVGPPPKKPSARIVKLDSRKHKASDF